MLDDPPEIWRLSPRFPKYAVSSLGQIQNVKTGYILQPYRMPTGYMQVNLCRKAITVHKVVLEAFAGPKPEGYQASHLNDDRSDNHLANLSWETPLQNTRRKALHGTQPTGDRHHCGRKTHCKRGHAFTSENRGKSARSCRGRTQQRK
jgi:hypothetical protein